MQPPAFQYTNNELLVAIEKLTLPELVFYVGSIWSSGKGIALVQGNLDERQAQGLVSSIDKTLGFKPISAEEYPAELVPLPLPKSPMATRLVIKGKNMIVMSKKSNKIPRWRARTQTKCYLLAPIDIIQTIVFFLNTCSSFSTFFRTKCGEWQCRFLHISSESF